MMRALLWKDLRILGDVVLGGIALLCGSYVLAFLSVYSDRASTFEWSKVIAGGASLTRFSSLLICALLGAFAFGREGEDGSLLFLTALPANRTRIVLSKIVVAAGLVAVIWLASLTIMLGAIRAMGYDWDTFGFVLRAMAGYIASSVMAFGSAWLLSFLLKTAVGAAFAGLVTLVPVYMVQFLVNWRFENDNPVFFHPATVVFMVAAGLLGVAAASVMYVPSGGGGAGAEPGIAVPWRGALSRARGTARPRSAHTRAGAFRSLLWKDFRLIKSSFVIGLGIVAVPYLIAMAGQRTLGQFRTASVVSIGLTALVVAFWSGQVMSAESASGTIEFLLSLPIRLAKRLASRLAVAFTPAILATAVNVLLLIAVNNAMPGEIRFDAAMTWDQWVDAPYTIMGLALANGTAMAFALAWFASAYYRRPAVAVVLGVLAAPVTVALWAALSTYCGELDRGPSPLQFAQLFALGAASSALVLILAGCLIARRERAQEA